MSVYLSVRKHISKTTRPNFSKFSVSVTYGRGSVLLWQQCNTLCVLPVLWITPCFHMIELIGQNQRRRVYFVR